MIQFLNFTFDPETGELFDGGRRIPLEHQPANMLRVLLATPGEVVTRSMLIDAVWRCDTHVNFDDNLNYGIRHLRRVLGDDARCPRFIETLPKRGYRFIAPVEAPTPPHSPWLIRGRWPLAAIATAVFGFAIETRPNNHHEVVTEMLTWLHTLIF